MKEPQLIEEVGCGRNDLDYNRVMTEKKQEMLDLLRSRGIKDQNLLATFSEIPRELFVASDLQQKAYEDGPLPIGEKQTISQPYIVAFMIEALQLKKEYKILEIGTGSGYNAAIMSRFVSEVHSIEIVPTLAKQAKNVFEKLHIKNIFVYEQDGHLGLPTHAPFDAIILTAAPKDKVPQVLFDQLKVGGKLISPVGPVGGEQKLFLYIKNKNEIESKFLMRVRFVPMTGKPE